MSENTDNSMEKRLQDYAARRRETMGEPLEMHEATRAMLQAEVQSVYGKPAEKAEKQPETQGFPAWLGWAIGGASVGVLAIAINLIPQNTNQNSDFAKNTANSPTIAKSQNDSADTIAEKNSQTELYASQNGSEGQGTVAGAVPPPFGAPHVAGAPGFTGPEQPKPRVAAAFPANAKTAYFNNQRAMRQNFSRLRNEPSNEPKNKATLPAPVLANFQIEREGNEVRVVDQDGSVYTGTVINEEEFAEAEQKEELARNAPQPGGGIAIAGAPSRPAAAPGEPGASVRLQPGVAKITVRAVPRGRFYFRATGTNRTLGKPVVVEATLDNPPLKAFKILAADQVKPAVPLATVRQAVKPGENAGPEGSDSKTAKKNAPNIQAIRAIARMRVLGNARIDKANYPLDATILQAVPVEPVKAPADEKKK